MMQLIVKKLKFTRMKNLNTRICLIVICILFIQIVNAQPKEKVIDKIAAVVGNNYIFFRLSIYNLNKQNANHY